MDVWLNGRGSLWAGIFQPASDTSHLLQSLRVDPPMEHHQVVARLREECTSYGPPLEHHYHHDLFWSSRGETGWLRALEPRLGRCGENLPTLHGRICAVYGCCSWGCPCWCVRRWWAAAEAMRLVASRTLSSFRTKDGLMLYNLTPLTLNTI